MKNFYLLMLTSFLFLNLNRASYGQAVCLVKDINPVHSDPKNLLDVNGTLFFTANDGTNGEELWMSDGTYAGTVMVKDIFPGSASSYIDNLCQINGILFFTASDGTNGEELWKSDGTSGGTVLVKDIHSGSIGSSPSNLTNVNGTLYFAAESSTTGEELWKSDGTSGGTVLVKDIYSGSNDGSPSNMIDYNGTLYFSAEDGVNGREFWKSDGTNTGTVMVMDINPAGSSYPSSLLKSNGNLFFKASDGITGEELWKSDGTIAGTAIVKDIDPLASSSPSYLTDLNGTLFFTASDGTNGNELWSSDGTSAGTVMVKDINPGSGSVSIGNLCVYQGILFFSANDGGLNTAKELWKSDGTAAGTVMVKDIDPSGSSNPKYLTVLNNIIYFSATNGSNGIELWRTDGTSAGTYMVKDIYPGSALNGSSPDNFAVSNGNLFFAALESTAGRELRVMSPSPSTASSGIQFSNIDLTSMELSWTNGDGTGRIVLVKSGAAVDAQPQDGISYTANSEFGAGSELGTGNYVVYDGTGSNVSITGLTSSTTYYFAIYEYNKYSCQAYLISSVATGQATTLTATSLMNKTYEEDKLTLYPNPSTSAEQISIESEIEVLSASVYTMQGNFIKDIFISNNKLIGLSDLTTGSYMLLLNTEKGTLVRKVVLK